MPGKIFGPRKRRTRQHVIADQGVHHVVGFILDEGHTAERFEYDYGYDRLMVTYNEQGYIEPGFVRLQIKAAENLRTAESALVYDLDVRDVNLWLMEKTPVILVLYDGSRKCAWWLDIQEYFNADRSRIPAKGVKTIRVHVPTRKRWNRQAVQILREMKLETFRRIKRGEE